MNGRGRGTVWMRCFLVAGAVLAGLLTPWPLFAQTMYWDSGFSPVTLAPLTGTDETSRGNSNARLILTGDAEISADTSAAAQLAGPGGVLRTEYRLGFDGEGTGSSGAGGTAWAPHDSFLVPPVRITHVPGDDEVEITLHVRASLLDGPFPDAGTYSAIQILTVSWVGP